MESYLHNGILHHLLEHIMKKDVATLKAFEGDEQPFHWRSLLVANILLYRDWLLYLSYLLKHKMELL